jgi:hypothetical protein
MIRHLGGHQSRSSIGTWLNSARVYVWRCYATSKKASDVMLYHLEALFCETRVVGLNYSVILLVPEQRPGQLKPHFESRIIAWSLGVAASMSVVLPSN